MLSWLPEPTYKASTHGSKTGERICQVFKGVGNGATFLRLIPRDSSAISPNASNDSPLVPDPRWVALDLTTNNFLFI